MTVRRSRRINLMQHISAEFSRIILIEGKKVSSTIYVFGGFRVGCNTPLKFKVIRVYIDRMVIKLELGQLDSHV